MSNITQSILATANDADIRHADSYFRSQIFTAHGGKNTILMAAQPIMALLQRYRRSEHRLQFQELFKKITLEVRAFTTYVNTYPYDEVLVAYAHYFVNAMLNHTICKANWLMHSPDATHDSLQSSQFADSQQGTLLLIDKMCEQPSKYIDVIELVYIGLTLGLISHRRNDDCCEQLYHFICQQRGDDTPTFAASAPAALPQQRQHPYSKKVLSTMVMASSTALLFTYLALNTIINHNATPIIEQLNIISSQLHTHRQHH